MNEQCWALTGSYDEEYKIWRVRLRQQISGRPSGVEADWHWALDQEEKIGNLVGFAHTHPVGSGTNPSARDIRTMQAWCSALGKPLLCLIAEGEGLNEPAAYVFDDDQSDGTVTKAFEILDS
jgi:proteasome lid subunit RPN8/RPN11